MTVWSTMTARRQPRRPSAHTPPAPSAGSPTPKERATDDPDPLTFAQEALGCREHTGYNTCIEHGGPTWPCFAATRLAALIEARDAQIRADECEKAAALVRARVTVGPAHVGPNGRVLERAAQHRGDKP